MKDEIRLVVPAHEEFHQIAHLVTGGLGARLDLTYEGLEDLQVALGALLGRRDDDGEIVVALTLDGESVCAAVGPFPAPALEELEHASESFGLRRVLETVCDSYEVEERDGGIWVELRKRTATAAGAAG